MRTLKCFEAWAWTGRLSKPRRPIRFGTDGWRAGIAEDYTFENVESVASAAAAVLLVASSSKKENSSKPLFIGYDRRFMSEVFAERAAKAAAAAGAKVLLSSRESPTPTLSLACLQNECSGAFMITASHNPAQDNGFKIKMPGGFPADRDVTGKVEEILDGQEINSQTTIGQASGSVETVDLFTPYFEALEKEAQGIAKGQLSGVVDSMHGAGGTLVQDVLKDKLQIKTIRGLRDPTFGGSSPEPVAKNLGSLSKAIKESNADFGLASDGDGDRVALMDGQGRFVSAHKVLNLLLYDAAVVRKGKGPVARTLSGSVVFDRIAKASGLRVHVTAVGFKHIARLMVEENLLMGGEESGGIGFQEHIPERDGAYCGLRLIRLFQETGLGPEALIEKITKEFGQTAYKRIDRRLSPDQVAAARARLASEMPDKLGPHKITSIDQTDGTKYLMGDDRWLLVRPSGTEPLLRIYAEAPTEYEVDEILAAGQEACGLE